MRTKEITKLIALFLLLVFAGSLKAQESQKKNSINLSAGSVVSAKMESFSPAIDLSYRREFFKGLGLNIGYKFKRYDTQGIPVEHEDLFSTYYDTYDYNSSLFYLGIDYCVKVNNIHIIPLIGLGYGSIKMFTNETNGNYNKKYAQKGWCKDKNPMMFLGIKAGYDFDRFTVFCSYNYDFPQINMANLEYEYTMDHVVYIKNEKYYHNGDFKLGVAFKF